MFGAPATGDGFSIVFPLILTAPASFKLPPWSETAPRFFCSAAPPPGGVTVSRYPLFPVIVTGILLSASLVAVVETVPPLISSAPFPAPVTVSFAPRFSTPALELFFSSGSVSLPLP